MRIYVNDERVHYKGTEVNALRSKQQVEGVLAEYGCTRTGWDWIPDKNVVVLYFYMNGRPVHFDCPKIWNKAKRGQSERDETVNWNVSMRVLYWFIKSLLEATYLLDLDKITLFLPFLSGRDGKQLRDLLIPTLDTLGLPPPEEVDRKAIPLGEKKDRITIDVEKT